MAGHLVEPKKQLQLLTNKILTCVPREEVELVAFVAATNTQWVVLI